MNKQLFFKEAQESMDALNWDEALVYLNEFKRRFPEDTADILAANYQIALIAFKRGQHDIARAGFEEIIQAYDSDISGALHEWVRVLSLKLLDRLNEPQPQPSPPPPQS